jgi:hypothetical protein
MQDEIEKRDEKRAAKEEINSQKTAFINTFIRSQQLKTP